MKSRSRENWARRSNAFTTHRNEKEAVEKLKQDPELLERISKVVVL